MSPEQEVRGACLDLALMLKAEPATAQRGPIMLTTEQAFMAAKVFAEFANVPNETLVRISCLKRAFKDLLSPEAIVGSAKDHLDFVAPKNEFVSVVDETAWNNPRPSGGRDYPFRSES